MFECANRALWTLSCIASWPGAEYTFRRGAEEVCRAPTQAPVPDFFKLARCQASLPSSACDVPVESDVWAVRVGRGGSSVIDNCPSKAQLAACHQSTVGFHTLRTFSADGSAIVELQDLLLEMHMQVA